MPNDWCIATSAYGALAAITREDLVAVVESVLLRHSSRRKLSILVYGKGRRAEAATGAADPDEVVQLQGLLAWKERQRMLQA